MRASRKRVLSTRRGCPQRSGNTFSRFSIRGKTDGVFPLSAENGTDSRGMCWTPSLITRAWRSQRPAQLDAQKR